MIIVIILLKSNMKLSVLCLLLSLVLNTVNKDNILKTREGLSAAKGIINVIIAYTAKLNYFIAKSF